MNANESENVFCAQCGRMFFRYAPLNVPFCICHINIVLSIDKTTHLTKRHSVPVPRAFYEAFENEKDFE